MKHYLTGKLNCKKKNQLNLSSPKVKLIKYDIVRGSNSIQSQRVHFMSVSNPQQKRIMAEMSPPIYWTPLPASTSYMLSISLNIYLGLGYFVDIGETQVHNITEVKQL